MGDTGGLLPRIHRVLQGGLVKRVTNDPYAGVAWSHFGRHKASMHVHTTESDGSLAVSTAIDGYRARGYTVLSITDHDNAAEFSKVSTWPWTDHGRDPAQLGMLAVQGHEFSVIDHTNSFFADIWTDDDLTNGTFDAEVNDTAWIFSEIGLRGGLAQVNHPGRYFRSNNYYLNLFQTHPHLIGIEVYNQGNRYPNDFGRWVDMLTTHRAAGHSLPIWGTSVDDMHTFAQMGRNYHVYLLPELTEAAMRSAMQAGSFYIVYDPLGADLERHVSDEAPGMWSAAPIIDDIHVGQVSISIGGRNYTSCEWRTDSNALVHTGDVLPLSLDTLGSFVYATLYGADGAVAHTQPWYLEEGGLIVVRVGGAEREILSTRLTGVGYSLRDIRRARHV